MVYENVHKKPISVFDLHSDFKSISDFFDPGLAPGTSKEEEKEQKPHTMAEKLPEGFFDNPKEDAKVYLQLNTCISILLNSKIIPKNSMRVLRCRFDL